MDIRQNLHFFKNKELVKRQDLLYLKPKEKRTRTENYVDFFQIWLYVI